MLTLRSSSLSFVLLAGLAACSGSSSSGSGASSVTLAVTDVASDRLSTFTIGLESVELVPLVGAPVSLLQRPTAVDFAALSDLSRVLNVTTIPADTYTGIEVELLFDNDRVFLNGETTPATLLDPATGLPLTGTLTLPIDFPVPLVVTTGNHVLELDLDLNQSVDVDPNLNEVYLEPTLIPRVNPAVPKEHAVAGDLRTVVLTSNLFRVGLEALPGDPIPVVTVTVDPTTVFQIDGQCLVGAAGLSALDALAPGSWVQAFGSVDESSTAFAALTVEAGTGSYNGGSDIVEGLIVGRNGDDLTVRGHSNNSTHTTFEFNLNYTVNTNSTNTKVVRRGSYLQYDTDELNIGQRVRMFGQLDTLNNVLDVTAVTDVVRVEPTHLYGLAVGAPANGQLVIDLKRVDLRDVNIFNWSEGGATPADPNNLVVSDPSNLSSGQGIVAGTPVEVVGFFAPTDDAGDDFVASSVANRTLTASLLVIRDRANGMTVTPSNSATEISFAFGGVSAGRETAVVDQGFEGETDVQGSGITVVQGPLGLGFYTIRDRTLNTLSVYLTFSAFSQALANALNSATLFNFHAAGVFDSGAGEVTSALASAVVQ